MLQKTNMKIVKSVNGNLLLNHWLGFVKIYKGNYIVVANPEHNELVEFIVIQKLNKSKLDKYELLQEYQSRSRGCINSKDYMGFLAWSLHSMVMSELCQSA